MEDGGNNERSKCVQGVTISSYSSCCLDMNQMTLDCQHLSPLRNMIFHQRGKRIAGLARTVCNRLTESHNAREGDGEWRKWGVIEWMNEWGRDSRHLAGAQVDVIFSLSVLYCDEFERICLSAVCGSDPWCFLLSLLLFIFNSHLPHTHMYTRSKINFYTPASAEWIEEHLQAININYVWK